MRRSAAPSQIGNAPKRPRFLPPFVGSSTIPDSVEKLNTPLTCKGSCVRDGQRSASAILSLIENHLPLDQSGNQSFFSDIEEDRKEDELTNGNNTVAVKSSHVALRSGMFEMFENVMVNTENGDATDGGSRNKNALPCISTSLCREEQNLPPSQLNGDGRGKCDDEQSSRYLSVMWCKLSKKKHKTWEGDAILIVQGRSASLVDMEGKEIAHGSGYKKAQLQDLTDGQMLVIGGKQIEVMGILSEEQYKSGKCFNSSFSVVESMESGPSIAAVTKPFMNPLKSGSVVNADKVSRKMMSVAPVDINAPGVLVMPRPSDSHQWQHNTDHDPVVDVVVESSISGLLRPHQREGVVFLYQCIMGMKSYRGYGAVLADEMGLGKTLQCITLIWTLYKHGPYGGKPVLKRILIITPGSLVKNWCKEFKKWLNMRMPVYPVGPDKKVEEFAKLPNCPVMIISYEMFVRNIETVREIKFDLLICDEGHRLKNTNIKTTSFVSGLLINRRIVLTGTPVQNDLQELYSIVDFVNPGVLGTVGAFRHVYEDPILASRQPNASNEELSLGQMRAMELNRVTSLFILRRTQEINNQYLPPKVDIVLFCGLTELQLSLYRKILSSRAVKTCLGDCYGSDTSQHLCCISALKKLCNHPDLLYQVAMDNAESDFISESNDVNKSLYSGLHLLYPNDYTRERNRTEHSSKLSILSKLLRSFRQSSPSERVVVVSNSTKNLNIIEALCKDCGYNYLRLDGNTATNRRQELVDRFNNRYMPDFVFLLSTKAGGMGLNLIGASRLVLYDIDWNPATDLQAMARVWRDGQKHRTYIYRLLSTGTIEEKMFQRQISKQGLSGVVIDSKINDSKQNFSPEQLRELFHIPDDRLCNTHDLLNCACQGEEELSRKPLDTSSAPTSTFRQCQLLTNKQSNQKNICMDELLEWMHISGPSPDLTHVDPLFPLDDLSQVTYAFWTESNKQEVDN